MRYFIANWKANKNVSEAKTWANDFVSLVGKDLPLQEKLNSDQIKIIICPAYPSISSVKEIVQKSSNIFVGSQDISSKLSDSFTGEVSALMLSNEIKYTIVGHSERRINFGETDEILNQKVQQAVSQNIKTVYCVRDDKDTIPNNADIVAYEPVYAIGTGNNEDPSLVVQRKKEILKGETLPFIYGGSVSGQNARLYLENPEIDGLLVGKASLYPDQFFTIVKSV